MRDEACLIPENIPPTTTPRVIVPNLLILAETVRTLAGVPEILGTLPLNIRGVDPRRNICPYLHVLPCRIWLLWVFSRGPKFWRRCSLQHPLGWGVSDPLETRPFSTSVIIPNLVAGSHCWCVIWRLPGIHGTWGIRAWESTGSGLGWVVAQGEITSIWWLGSWKEVVEIWYGEVDLLPIGVLKSKLPITSSYGSNSTPRSLAILSCYHGS